MKNYSVTGLLSLPLANMEFHYNTFTIEQFVNTIDPHFITILDLPDLLAASLILFDCINPSIRV